MDAERKTNVEIALIKVKLPDVQRDSFIFDSLEKAKEQREYTYNTENTQLAENDFLKAIVEQYKMEVEAGVKLIKEYYAMSSSDYQEFKAFQEFKRAKERDENKEINQNEI